MMGKRKRYSPRAAYYNSLVVPLLLRLVCLLVATQTQLHGQVIHNMLLLLLLVGILVGLVLLLLRLCVRRMRVGVTLVLLRRLRVRGMGVCVAGVACCGMLVCCMRVVCCRRGVGGQGHVLLRVVLRVGGRVLGVVVDVLTVVSLEADRRRG